MAEKRLSKKVGALWLKQHTKDGKKVGYMTGTLNLGVLGQAQIVVFKNTFKEKDAQPDYNILLSEPHEAERQPGEDDDEGDIPF